MTPRPIADKKAKLALVHIAKKDLALPDDAYRAILGGAAGISSAAELQFEHQFKAVMKAFENIGFKSVRQKAANKTRPQWKDQWGGTPDQRAKIETMWKAYARNPSDQALRAFIKRIAKVDHPRFLRVDLARKVIIALEAIARKKEKA